MPFARPLARLLWFAMLWFMRRPWVKAARRNIPNFSKPEKREQAWNRIRANDAWALKHGLSILTVIFNLVIGYLFVATVYAGLLWYTATHPDSVFNLNQVP